MSFLPTDDRLLDIAAISGTVFAAADTGGLQVFDVANPTRPQRVRAFATGGTASALAVAGGYAAVASRPDDGRCADSAGQAAGLLAPSPFPACVLVLDVQDTSRVKTLASIEIVDQAANGTLITSGGIHLDRSRLLVLDQNASYFGGRHSQLHLFDFGTPAQPIEQASVRLPGAIDLAMVDGSAFTALAGGGWAQLATTDLAAPVVTSMTQAPMDALAIAVRNDHVFIGDPQRVGIEAIDVADPTRPRETGFARLGDISFGGSDVVTDLAIAGDRLYAASGSLGVSIHDLRNPASLPKLGNLAAGQTRVVAAAGHYAYVATMDGSLHVFDVAEPRKPDKVGMLWFVTTTSPVDIVVDGHVVYLVDGRALYLIDVTDPADPRMVKRLEPSATVVAVSVANSRVYTVDKSGGVVVIDASDPAEAHEVGRLNSTAPAATSGAIAVAGLYVFASHGPNDLIRTRSAAPVGHGSLPSRNWQPPAASTAATALAKAAKKLSPSPREVTTTPPCPSITSVTIRLCRSRAASIASGTVSHSRVEPSMSVSKNVTVPACSSAPMLIAASAKLSLSNTARSSARSRSSSLGVAKVRYDTVPAARMLSIIAVSRGSWSGAGRFRYSSIGFPAASRYSSSSPEIYIPGATQPYRCQ